MSALLASEFWILSSLPSFRLHEIHAVIRRLLRNRDVVRVAFRHAGGGNSAEAGLRAQLVDVPRPAVAHAGPQPADELVDEVAERPAVRHAAFDAFGNQFTTVANRALPVTVAGAGDH